jgi:tRNA(Ile)-lysidine synthase
VYLIRPLLRHTRAEVRAFLERRGLGHCEDRSNSDLARVRNRVRHQLLPQLEALNPRIKAALARLGEISRWETEVIGEAAARWLQQHGREQGQAFGLDLTALGAAPLGLRMAVYRASILRVAGDLRRIALVHLEALDRLVISGPPAGSLDLPGIRVCRQGQRLKLQSSTLQLQIPNPKTQAASLPLPGAIAWPGPEGEITITAQLAPRPSLPPDPWRQAWLDPGQLKLPLRVRSREPGDRYQPFGFQGRRKLKDVMNQLGLSSHQRDHWPLVCDEGRIVWVPGLRSAHGIAGEVKTVALVSIEEGMGEGEEDPEADTT